MQKLKMNCESDMIGRITAAGASQLLSDVVPSVNAVMVKFTTSQIKAALENLGKQRGVDYNRLRWPDPDINVKPRREGETRPEDYLVTLISPNIVMQRALETSDQVEGTRAFACVHAGRGGGAGLAEAGCGV